MLLFYTCKYLKNYSYMNLISCQAMITFYVERKMNLHCGIMVTFVCRISIVECLYFCDAFYSDSYHVCCHRLQQQDIQKKREDRASMVKDRATRALRRSLSRTNSECGSTGSIPDSLTDNRSNRSSTFVGRQTNNSLSSATGQIVIQGLRQKLRSSQV
jgi:hypothetical protein